MYTRHLRTLFRSDLLHVFDYRCMGHADAKKDEVPQGHELVLPPSLSPIG
jgi:hypothetical protein